jgi:ubiquinone/menaquinone biosynthesis C-methylase UbiE
MKPSEIIAIANKDLYKRDYENIVMSGGFLNRWVYKKTHQELERFHIRNSQSGISILELGAQADQHRPWVRMNFRSYVVSDIDIEPLLNSKLKYESNLSKSDSQEIGDFPQITFKQIDAEHIDYPDNTFDRLLATCLIVHLQNPIDALHEWRRVTRDKGQIDFYVPCEPGLILRLARSLTHKRKKLSVGFPYDLLHYSQHKNHFPAINEFLKFVFADDQIKRRFFPLTFLPWGFNLWAVYSIQISKTTSSETPD